MPGFTNLQILIDLWRTPSRVAKIHRFQTASTGIGTIQAIFRLNHSTQLVAIPSAKGRFSGRSLPFTGELESEAGQEIRR